MSRSILFAGAVLLTAGVALAQTETKPAASQSATLTAEERGRAVDYLERTRNEFKSALEGVSEAQWKFKPAPDRWSIAETAEHVALTEETIWQLVREKMMKSPPTPERRGETLAKDERILTGVPDRSRKAEAPERLQPTGKWATREELLKAFEEARTAEIAFLRGTKEDLRSRFEDHPFLKTIDAYQWLLLNGAHGKRHTAQILEVKADPNFPKS